MNIIFQSPNVFELVPRLWVGGYPLVSSMSSSLTVDFLVLCAREWTAEMARLEEPSDYLQLDLVDENNTPPTAEQVAAIRHALALAQLRYERGDTVVFSCQAAKNQSCALAALFLIERGWTAEQAMMAIRIRRPGALTNHGYNDLLLSWKKP
jgi:hypothetical protein